MKYYGEEFDRKKSRGKSVTRDESWQAESEKALNTARLISVNGFTRLFEDVGSRSGLKQTLDDHQYELAKAGTEARRQAKKDEELQDNIECLENQQDE